MEVGQGPNWGCSANEKKLVTNNAGSGLDDWVYLLSIHTTSNYT
jgi:hypothetical protein